MTVEELWTLTTYVGKVKFEDNEHGFFSPLVAMDTKVLMELITRDDHEYHWLANVEVAYFDFMFDTLRICLKGEYNGIKV